MESFHNVRVGNSVQIWTLIRPSSPSIWHDRAARRDHRRQGGNLSATVPQLHQLVYLQRGSRAGANRASRSRGIPIGTLKVPAGGKMSRRLMAIYLVADRPSPWARFAAPRLKLSAPTKCLTFETPHGRVLPPWPPQRSRAATIEPAVRMRTWAAGRALARRDSRAGRLRTAHATRIARFLHHPGRQDLEGKAKNQDR